MSVSLERTRRALPAWMARLGRVPGALAVVALGIVLGLQFIRPDKRVLATTAAAVLFGLAWRADMVTGLGILALALPFPRGTVFGSTNLAFILLLLVIWLLRTGQPGAAAPRRTPLDMPILGLLIAYVISFYNVEDMTGVRLGIERFMQMFACVLMFYLVVANVRTERDLKRLLGFQAVSVAMVCLLGIYELNHAGGTFIPGWIDFRTTHGTDFNQANVRIGSSFYDYELLSEYAAINMLLVIFLFQRAGSLLARMAVGALLVLVSFVLFATTTRGSVISLGVAAVYFLWVIRRRLNAVSLISGIAMVTAAFFAMNYYVANFTHSGNLLTRLDQTQFKGGIPDSRLNTWPEAFARMMEHPIIGHGPYYATVHGIKFWAWPHCLYLYIGNNAGLVGLGMFLFLLWRLWKVSRPPGDDLRDPSYARAFLLIAHLQVLVFMVDEIKIEFMRNTVYQFQVWLMFAIVVSASLVARRAAAEAPGPARVLRSAA